MPDDNSSSLLSEATAPTLAERKSRIVASWVRFAKTICRGHAAFILDTAGGRVRVTFLDGQGDVLDIANEMALALPPGENFALFEAVDASGVRDRERAAAVVGLRVNQSKILCILAPASRMEHLNDRRIAALSSIAKLCGSVLSFGLVGANSREPRTSRFGAVGRFGAPQGSGRFYSAQGSRRPAP